MRTTQASAAPMCNLIGMISQRHWNRKLCNQVWMSKEVEDFLGTQRTKYTRVCLPAGDRLWPEVMSMLPDELRDSRFTPDPTQERQATKWGTWRTCSPGTLAAGFRSPAAPPVLPAASLSSRYRGLPAKMDEGSHPSIRSTLHFLKNEISDLL